MKKNHKAIPKLSSDKQAQEFVERADLTRYNLSRFSQTHFEFEPKLRTVSLRLSESLYATVRHRAKREGIKTQRFIRRALERAAK